MNQCIKTMVAVFLVVFTVSFSTMAESIPTSKSVIVDFGDPNAKQFVLRLNSLVNNQDHTHKVVNITQFGDSHTAADFFTGEFRALMQDKYGDAGIGWVPPVWVKGQNHTRVSLKDSNWELLSSRVLSNLDFPMGGFIAKPINSQASIELALKADDRDIWKVSLIFKTKKITKNPLSIYNKDKIAFSFKNKFGGWQTTTFTSTLPITIKSKDSTEIGGFWLTRANKSGVIVSAIGSNGAKQTIWQKWRPQWFQELLLSKSDLVILEYGTNESFDETLDADEYRKNLVYNIRKIRKLLPNAAILLISPPDTMINQTEIPKSYNLVKRIQKQVAKSEKTLFWDWQAAMGGSHSVKLWSKFGLARSDLVHQTLQGYKESAKIFYNDLNEFVKKNSD